MTTEELLKAAKFTVFIGKNGAGKSTLLRSMNSGQTPNFKYISPERGGTLRYDPGVDNNIASNENWLKDTRQTNRFEQFRQQSAAQFRNLETAVLREIEKDKEKRGNFSYTFDAILDQINELLPAIRMIRNDKGGFSIQTKLGQQLDEGSISSGESELIALAIEVLVFSRLSIPNKVILLDEPDVHLHPDLQQRFTYFVETIANEHDLRVVIATHSTAIIGAFSKDAELQIIPIIKRNQTEFWSFSRTEVSESILPIFGAHPLSSAFNKSPVILVEGEDDRRVIEQIVRSSNGKFSISPCAVGGVTELARWEDWLNKFLPALYDSSKAFSLRDHDDAQNDDLNDLEHVCRLRLSCYAMENILLSDQVLENFGFDSASFKLTLQTRTEKFPDHKYTPNLSELLKDFENRKNISIKDVRNIIVAELGSNKQWEVIVGQSIAANINVTNQNVHSIQSYIGPKILTSLFNFSLQG